MGMKHVIFSLTTAAYGLKSVYLRYFNATGAEPADQFRVRHEPETHVIPLRCSQLGGHKAITVSAATTSYGRSGRSACAGLPA